MASLRKDLAEMPGLALAGAALDGVGIAACVGSADSAATKIIGDLGVSDQDQSQLDNQDRLEESRR